MGFSSLNESFSFNPFLKNHIRVIRRECAGFQGLPLNILFAHWLPLLNISVYAIEAQLVIY